MTREKTVFGLRFYLLDAGEASGDLEVVIACIGALALAFGLLVPLDLVKPFVGPCTFKVVTGIPCGTCGATRAVEALFAGHLLDVIVINPLFGLVLLVGVVYVPVSWVLWLARWPRPRLAIPSKPARRTVVVTIVLLFLLNWAYLIVQGR